MYGGRVSLVKNVQNLLPKVNRTASQELKAALDALALRWNLKHSEALTRVLEQAWQRAQHQAKTPPAGSVRQSDDDEHN